MVHPRGCANLCPLTCKLKAREANKTPPDLKCKRRRKKQGCGIQMMENEALGPEARTFSMWLEHNVVENNGCMVSGLGQTHFWLGSCCSFKKTQYCPTWNFWKLELKMEIHRKMNERVWSFCQSRHSYTRMSANVWTFRWQFSPAVRFWLICSCLNTVIDRSFQIWPQIFFCISGIRFSPLRLLGFWGFLTQIWPFPDCLKGTFLIYLPDCRLTRWFLNKALCAECWNDLPWFRVCAAQIWAPIMWNCAVSHWIDCWSSSKHCVHVALEWVCGPFVFLAGGVCDSETALQKSGSAESLSEEYCFSLFQHSCASGSF